MTRKPNFIDIFSLICPLSAEVRWVGASSAGRSPKWLNSDSNYRKWIKELKSKELQPEICIIDSIPIKDINFYLRFYQDLFKTWGFSLFHNNTFESVIRSSNDFLYYLKKLKTKVNTSDINFSCKTSLSSYTDIPKIERKIEGLITGTTDLNDKILLKELQLQLCLNCYVGLSASNLAHLKWDDLVNTNEIYCQVHHMYLPIDGHTIDVARSLATMKDSNDQLVFSSAFWINSVVLFSHVMNSIFFYFHSNIRISPGYSDLDIIYGLMLSDKHGRQKTVNQHLIYYFKVKARAELICLLEYYHANSFEVRPTNHASFERLRISTIFKKQFNSSEESNICN